MFYLHKQDSSAPDYLKILDSKISYVRFYPKTFEQFIYELLGMSHGYDETIARLCHKHAVMFLYKHKEDEDEEIKAQCIVLEYLLFRMINNHYRVYISTKELRNQLEYTGVQYMSISTFCLKIICKLRDADVIISSPSKGDKIPSNEAEIYDFINHGNQVVLPMIWRLKKCRDLVELATNRQFDLLEHDKYNDLNSFLDPNYGI